MMHNIEGYILGHPYDAREHLTVCGKCGSPKEHHFEIPDELPDQTPPHE